MTGTRLAPIDLRSIMINVPMPFGLVVVSAEAATKMLFLALRNIPKDGVPVFH